MVAAPTFFGKGIEVLTPEIAFRLAGFFEKGICVLPRRNHGQASRLSHVEQAARLLENGEKETRPEDTAAVEVGERAGRGEWRGQGRRSPQTAAVAAALQV